MDTIAWSDPGFTGQAYLWPDATNQSNAFRRLNSAGQQAVWAEAPQVRIPVEGGSPLLVAATLTEDSMLAVFVLTAEQSNAAIAAGVMHWLDAGRRVGTISVWRQS